MLQDPAEIKAQYRYWQRRILFSTIVGYAMFYFVRKNLSVAMPGMGSELGIGKADLGLFLTLHGLLYGVSKFANGFLGDRANARTFMAVGLILSAIVNIFFGFSSAVLTLGLLWMLNGWVQGMGFPPCARLMTHWFSPEGTGHLLHRSGTRPIRLARGWWWCCAATWRRMAGGCVSLCPRAWPSWVRSSCWYRCGTRRPPWGCRRWKAPKIRVWVRKVSPPLYSSRCSGNKYIWLLGMASFFVYIVRYAVLDWGPTFLTEMKQIKLTHAGWMVAAFEVSGVAGMLVSGWLTDRVFGGRGARLCVFSMLLTALFTLLFWKLPTQSVGISTLLLCLVGFFVYGPQALVGVVVANLATKRLAATAIGLTSVFSYASTLVSGWGLGALVQHYGWSAGLAGLTGTALMSALLFALVWPAKAHGYPTPQAETTNP